MISSAELLLFPGLLEHRASRGVSESMPAKPASEWIGDWICLAFHRRWWKPAWIAGAARIELRCERCGRVH
jgi:hypothetical protein